MADFLVRLTEINIKATSDALDVFNLYKLERDSSYPFLEQHNWKVTSSHEDYDIT